ncbi:TPA: polysaccharide biosynthesis protein [Enterococcus faecium]|uniref:UDP-N-acetylglucosamine 4,6-dehydratase family protein n=1 Tax=Enterococcus sp. C46 TaxID=3231307 RepID=UPI0019DD779A|nr:polysaccharide biosynthesis protein [Enterococcus faecium]MDB7249771.1 polysaccharide biosynthesis protein [Enterococcus faecium]MDB7259813.1 polysaccharide biosynthesis protein [Enterococcus faecium]MDB7279591.1 polysaccharide biosynthesis protein [Enterococcus faecium]MDQ8408333.1 polysaccharide biosynthesis protein [Enterococcus faecium]
MFENKVILVTGGTGSIGSELVRQLLKYNPKAIRIFSRGEEKQFYMQQQLAQYKNVRFLIGDVRDYQRVEYASRGVDIIFHAAAMKHVPASEYNPMEAVKTNVNGTQNVIEAAISNNVEKFVAISTDKVVNPTTTMGATKLLMERIVIAANQYKGKTKTVFSCVRFGNVMGSSGSVIPLFCKQIENNLDLTLTHNEMTRFMMSIPQAVKLVIDAAKNSTYGETYVLKMPSIKISTIAEYMIEDYNREHSDAYKGEIKITGIRPGEKLYEELMTTNEIERSFENDSMYVIPPLFHADAREYEKYESVKITSYSSNTNDLMTKKELMNVIKENKIIEWN